MRQYKFNIGHTRKEAYEKLEQFAEECAEHKDVPIDDVIYYLDDHVDYMDEDIKEALDDLVRMEIIDNVKQMCGEDTEDWRMGDIYMAGDADDIKKGIREELYNRWVNS